MMESDQLLVVIIISYLIIWQAEVNHLSAACSGSLREGGEKLSQERYLKGQGGKKGYNCCF